MIILATFILLKPILCTDQLFVSNVLPSKKLHLKFGGNEYYFHVSNKVNYFQAFSLCKLDKMELVDVSSSKENNRLGIYAIEIGHGHDHFWTSGTNLPDSQEWIWFSTGKPLKYTNWYVGEPNLGASGKDTTERCMEARTLDKGHFTWNNVPCERQYYYICKKKLDYSKRCNRTARIKIKH